ncbi:MAG: YchJ family metal-binding protein [Cyanobacteria bacterium P01_F01_bin.150]
MAPTAEALMRSRYTAFVKGDVDYLISTHRADNQSANERAKLCQTVSNTSWLGLTVLNTQRGQSKDKKGIVEFVALYSPKVWQATSSSGSMLATPSKSLSNVLSNSLSSSSPEPQISQLHERSRFIREGDCWFYVDGDQLPPLMPKRNEPCWCRSGKKFKYCHGKS